MPPRKAAQSRPPARGGRQTPAGDATGRKRDDQIKENQAELQDAATRMSMATPPPPAQGPQSGDPIVDYTGDTTMGVREIDPSELGDDTEIDANDDDENIDIDSLPDGTTQVSPDEPRPEDVRTLDEPEHRGANRGQAGYGFEGARTGQVQQADVAVLEKPFKVLRVNTDLDEVTIGRDPVTGDLRHFTFKVGQRYKVPRNVYDHLDEKGYVWH